MILERILAKRIVPVVVLDSADHAEPLAEALLAGGLDIMEITFRTEAAEESIKRIAKRFPEILLGAGTLLEKKQVKRAKKAGAGPMTPIHSAAGPNCSSRLRRMATIRAVSSCTASSFLCQ